MSVKCFSNDCIEVYLQRNEYGKDSMKECYSDLHLDEKLDLRLTAAETILS